MKPAKTIHKRALVLCLLAAALFFQQGILSFFFAQERPGETLAGEVAPVQKAHVAQYQEVKLEDAPENIREAVLLGYAIMNETPSGGKLACRHCHFQAGRTKGGKEGGIALAGVAATYPRPQKGSDSGVHLVARISDCFTNSLNKKPPDPESHEMQGLVAYLHWISRGIAIYAQVPWLGLPPVEESGKPDLSKGGEIYKNRCAGCHSEDGAGTEGAPPVWGPESFTGLSLMGDRKKLAAFILLNMPKGKVDLTAQEAADVAAFVTGRPRPVL